MSEVISDNEEPSSSRDVSTPKKKRLMRGDLAKEKKVHQKQYFRQEWLQKEEFRMWLKEVEGDKSRAKCTLCNKDFVSELTVLKNHSTGKKHIQRVQDCKPKSLNIMRHFTDPVRNRRDDDNVKRAELKLSSFLAAHNVAFLASSHLSEVLKNCFPDSEIAKKIHLKRTKAKCVIKNVIGESQKESMTIKIKDTKFSILMDESTDIGCVKCACLIVRFYDEEEGAIVSRFWELVQVFSNDDAEGAEVGASAERLFTLTLESFTNKGVPVENIIGFGSDNCNTMMGVNNSVATRFANLCPGIVILGCICHSLHLCASSACRELPRSVEDMARNIYAYFQNSAKRKAQFSQFQTFLDLEVHKILHPSQTRWLSLAAVVGRILEQWEALRLYFNDQWLSHHSRNSESIHVMLNDPFIKAYFIFLKWALPKFTKMNQFFQSDKTVITKLNQRMTLAYEELLQSYCRRDYINQCHISDVDPNPATANLLPLNTIYMGVDMLNHLSRPDIQSRPDILQDFLLKCQNFLIKACCEIRQRFDFRHPVLSAIHALSPENAISNTFRDTVPSLVPLMSKLPRCAPEEAQQNIDDQWRRLPICANALPTDITTTVEVDVFWHKILKYEDEYLEFSDIAKFALSALSLPHSNAECERVFSKINNIKTKTRNRLITPTINGVLLADQAIRSAGNSCCVNFEPKKAMLDRMTSANIYGPEKKDSQEDEEDLDDIQI